MNEALMTMMQYARVALPKKPRLAPWVSLVDLGDDRLQLRGADFAYTLQNPLFIQVLETIAPLLDGQHEVEDIATCDPSRFAPSTVVFLLQMLRANGVLQESAAPTGLSDDDLRRWHPQIRFLSHFVPDAAVLQASLGRAKVAVLGSAPLGAQVLAALESLGIGGLSDGYLTFSPVEDMLPRLEVSASAIDADLLVVCADYPAYGVFDRVNAACLRRGTRWMRIDVEGTEAFLGPTVIPHQTACYTCYDRRVRSQQDDRQGFVAFRDLIARGGERTGEGTLTALGTVLSGQAALEVARLLSGFVPPLTVGRFYTFSVVHPEATGHDILRVPRCPSCQPDAPAREAWDQTFAILES